MSTSGWLFTLGILFVLIGIGLFIWSKVEARSYIFSLVKRRDLREFMERTPTPPEPVALRNGGIISLVISLWLLLAGFFFL